MALTELQRKRLIEGINNLPINTILSYFQSGEICFTDVPNISAERREYIQQQLDQMPNPQEQREWAEIQSNLINPSQELLNKIASYVRKWEGTRPAGNHVDEAREIYNQVEQTIVAQAEELETTYKTAKTSDEEANRICKSRESACKSRPHGALHRRMP